MKLFALCIFHKDVQVKQLVSAFDLQSFGYFQRSSVKEFMQFTSKILIERTRPNERATVKEQDYLCHVYVRMDSLGACLIADNEYPQRVAFTLLNKLISHNFAHVGCEVHWEVPKHGSYGKQILEEFIKTVPQPVWRSAAPDSVVFPACEENLQKYQNPREADAMTKVQSELDETKIVLHNTIEAVLDRGEKLDDLVEKSEGLSMQSKTFYKTAKKSNSCCCIQ